MANETIFTINVIDRIRIIDIVASRRPDSNDTRFVVTYLPYATDSRYPDDNPEILEGSNLGEYHDESDLHDMPAEVRNAWILINKHYTNLIIEDLRNPTDNSPPPEEELPPPNPNMLI